MARRGRPAPSRKPLPEHRPTHGRAELADYVVAHYQDMLSLYGVESGLRQARKHLGWYLDRHAPFAAAEMRKTVLTATDPATVIAALQRGLRRASPADQQASRMN